MNLYGFHGNDHHFFSGLWIYMVQVHNKITIDIFFPSYIQTSIFVDVPLVLPNLVPWFSPSASSSARRLMTLSCGQMQGTATSFILWQMSTDLIKSTRKIGIWPEKLRVNSLTYLLISDLTVFRLQTEDSACKHSGNEDVSNKLMVIFSSWPSLAILEKSGSIAAQIAKLSDGHPRFFVEYPGSPLNRKTFIGWEQELFLQGSPIEIHGVSW